MCIIGTYWYPGYLLKTHHRRWARSSDTRFAEAPTALAVSGLFCQYVLLGFRKCSAQVGSIGRADSRACIPSWLSGIDSVIATGHISQGLGIHELLVILVELRIQVANRLPSLLIHKRDQARPERRNGACSTKHDALPIDIDIVTCLGIGIPCDIRHPATDMMVRICRRRYSCIGLPGGKGEEITDATTCG